MPLHMSTPMPSLSGGTNWYNSTELNNDDFKGFLTLIHFFSVSCGSCKESLPDLNRWIHTYAKSGFKILSVHMPRSESDTNISLVEEVIKDYKMEQPVVVDNWHTITDAFANKYVPAYYLFDKDLKLRHFQAGEKAIKMVEPVIERLLKESSSD